MMGYVDTECSSDRSKLSTDTDKSLYGICTTHNMQFWNAKMGADKVDCPWCQLAALQAQLDSALAENESFYAINEENKKLRTRCEAAEERSQHFAEALVNELAKVEELEKESSVLKTPQDCRDAYARGLAEGKRLAYEDAVEILLGLFWFQPHKENEPVIYRDQAIDAIKAKLGGE